MRVDVSVIVLCWNHCNDLTKPFVDNFLQRTSGVNYELILFNNGSVDGTKKFLDGINDSRVRVIHSRKNLGFGGGNNQALQSARGEYILFMNNDVLIKQNNWLSELLKVAKGGKRVVGVELVNSNKAVNFRFEEKAYINGWCLMIDRVFLDKYGAFDKDFSLAYYEDVELCQRAMSHGYELSKVNVDLVHLGSKSSVDQLDMPAYTKYNQYVYRNLMMKLLKGDRKRIVFYCPGNYQFIDEDYEGRGVGGAEASLIQLSRELARLGWIVDIFNGTSIQGTFNGVNYFNLENYHPNEFSDVFVLFRNSYGGLSYVNSPLKIFWSCDQMTTNDWEVNVIPFVDETWAISKYHRDYLYTHYPFPRGSIKVIDLGVKISDYQNNVEKKYAQLLFCSVPKRGLEHMASIFPKIKEKIPEATLFITSDYTLWGGSPDNQREKELLEHMPGVTFLGKVSRERLVELQNESMIMSYPCNYDENFCISAMECIAAGTIPVTTPIGAMVTTISDTGILIKGDPSTTKYQEQFISEVVNLLENDEVRFDLSNKCKIRGKRYSWDKLAKDQWDIVLKNKLPKYMNKYKANYCKKCGKQFNNGYAFFKHRADKHQLPDNNTEVRGGSYSVNLRVEIKTTRRVELGINKMNFNMVDVLIVPQESAGEVIRILNEAYGPGIIKDTNIIK